MFTFADLMLGKFLHFFHLAFAHSLIFETASTLIIITLLLAAFYRLFFPIKISLNYILIGSLVTAILWMGMRPLFTEVFSANHSYGAIFGGMKNVFVSLAWLYYTFAIFLLGTELIATLHKRDILLLRGLFNETENGNQAFMEKLIGLYGISFKHGDTIFKDGEEGDDLYYVVSGKISLIRDGKLMRHLKEGDYFGEMAMLSDPIRIADAIVDSPVAEVIAISSENIQALVLSEPKIAMRFLGHMALQLKNSRTENSQT
jgi:membrane protein